MTKKYFQAIDPKTNKAKKGFVVPVRTDGSLRFQSLDNKKEFDQFITVFLGVDLTPEIVFKKMVDSGFKFESVEQTLSDLEQFLVQARSSRIGHIYRTKPDAEFEFDCLGKIE